MTVYLLLLPALAVPLYAWLRFARTPRRRDVQASLRPYLHVYPPFEEGDPREEPKG